MLSKLVVLIYLYAVHAANLVKVQPIRWATDLSSPRKLMANAFGIPMESLVIENQVRDWFGVMHIYMNHFDGNIHIANDYASIHASKTLLVFISSFGKDLVRDSHSFLPHLNKGQRLISQNIIKSAQDKFGIPLFFQSVPVLWRNEMNHLIFSHNFQLRDDKSWQWLEVFANAHTGEILQVMDLYNRGADSGPRQEASVTSLADIHVLDKNSRAYRYQFDN